MASVLFLRKRFLFPIRTSTSTQPGTCSHDLRHILNNTAKQSLLKRKFNPKKNKEPHSDAALFGSLYQQL
jgi:hypothetical protein